jgi:TolB-like protein/Tfp pilus assembly protein PilF
MPSIIQGYEYDIFISYRHNDNRSGWVTEFIRHLNEELAATIKEPVSVYFDNNTHDGLLETHSVDKTLEGKLKCLIFIPILSQTYCDTKSFAWQHELCAFNQLAREDQFGRDIKLSNGNITSRILPIKIHDIDAEDKTVFENETGGVLRAIEFIYKEPGVNRPLKFSDKKNENQNKTEYGNQINKIANAVKEIISALKNPAQVTASGTSTGTTNKPKINYRKLTLIATAIILLSTVFYFLYPRLIKTAEPALLDKSIAVLPFTDMSPDHDQEYLGDGIAEDIINALSQINGLKVIGRTSSFQFKDQKIDLREIGEKLEVSTVLEGSVMKSGNKIRITAQLINVKDGRQLWSERYDREANDIFTVQDEITAMIVDKLKLSILYHDQGGKSKIPTTNLDAYENVLKGQHLLNDGIHNAKHAQPYFEKAIELDPDYVDAYSGLALSWYLLPLINEITPHESVQKVNDITTRILAIDPDNFTAHNALFMVHYYYSYEWEKAEAEYKKAMEIAQVPSIGHALFLHDVYNDNDAAIKEMTDFLKINPLNKDAMRLLAHLYAENKQFSLGEDVLEKIIAFDSIFGPAYCELGMLQLYEHKYNPAYENFKKCDLISPQWNGKTGLIISLVNTGRMDEARKLVSELDEDTMNPGARVYMHFAIGEMDQGFEWLEKAYHEGDPLIAQIRDLPSLFPIESDPRYLAMVKKLNFPK